MIFIKLVIFGLALWIAFQLYMFWLLGRGLAQLKAAPAHVPHIGREIESRVADKKNLFKRTACLLGTLLLFIVCVDSSAFVKDGHLRPEFFGYHLVSGLAALGCFGLMRVCTGMSHPNFHRWLGYGVLAVFVWIIGSGLYLIIML